jgi:hypothetical protein
MPDSDNASVNISARPKFMNKEAEGYVCKRPNVVVECLTLLVRIRYVRGSNIGPDTCCPDEIFVLFLRPSKQMPG